MGELEEAAAYFAPCEADARSGESWHSKVMVFDSCGILAIEQQDYERAASAFTPHEAAARLSIRDAICCGIGNAFYESAWRRGRSLQIAEALNLYVDAGR